MHLEPTSICRALVGLADVDVVGVIPWTVPMQVHIASTLPRPSCSICGASARVKQTMRRRLGRSPLVRPASGDGVASGPLALPERRLCGRFVDVDRSKDRDRQPWDDGSGCPVGHLPGRRSWPVGGGGNDARERRQGLLAAGDPKGQVADAWTAN